jgi:hypothetical protein
MSGASKVLTVGSDLNQLDIFLSSNGVAIDASGISFNVYDANNSLAASGVPTHPETGKYLGSGVIPDGFVLGMWHIDWVIIPTGASQFIASEDFSVQALSVSFGFAPATDQTSTIYDAVRIDVGDPDGLIFNDGFLQRVLIKAVRRLNQALGLAVKMHGPTGIEGEYGGRRIRVYPLVVDVEAGTVTPNDDEYTDLIILQMEYIIKTSELAALARLNATITSSVFQGTVNSSLNDGVMVQNADNVIVSVSVGRFQTRATLMRLDIELLRDELNAAIKRFLGRLTGSMGKMVF